MSDLASIISDEFQNAMDVKDKGALHRGISLLLNQTVDRQTHEKEHSGLNAAMQKINGNIELLALEMREGFKRMDERFTAADKRFEDMNQSINQRFEESNQSANQRFADMNLSISQRFEDMNLSINQRFEDQNRRFEAMDKRFNRQTALISLGFVATTTFLTVLKIWG